MVVEARVAVATSREIGAPCMHADPGEHELSSSLVSLLRLCWTNDFLEASCGRKGGMLAPFRLPGSRGKLSEMQAGPSWAKEVEEAKRAVTLEQNVGLMRTKATRSKYR